MFAPEMSEPWTVVTDEFVTAERLGEIIDEIGMRADQSSDWMPAEGIAIPTAVPADAVITEALFEGGWLTLKWHRPGDASDG